MALSTFAPVSPACGFCPEAAAQVLVWEVTCAWLSTRLPGATAGQGGWGGKVLTSQTKGGWGI